MNNFPYILSVYSCGATAIRLRDYLNETLDVLDPGHCSVCYRKELEAWPPVIRWGNSTPFALGETDNYNNCEHIAITSSKARLSALLQRAGIPVITFQKDEPSANDYPVVIRTIMYGQGGQGIIFASCREEWLPYKGKSWSKFIKFEFEIRLHALAGNAVRVFKKILDQPDAVEPAFPIRNDMNGYHFSLRKLENYVKATDLAQKIYKIFPIEMVGWDMGWDAENHQYVVIEGNSAPSLNSVSTPIYGNFLLNKVWGKGGDNA
jgi:hypothetical protein